ncbi:MAG: molybdopterin-dependent oxidoreductase [Planctomycetes bacterium]|nr:molybdopterin-dependent oxidoreductase [Planctomycetota bacterium]
MGNVKLGFIERLATKLGVIPKLAETDDIEAITDGIKSGDFPLYSFPPQDKWDHWEELDSAASPLREKRAYTIVPTTCFNCESACGLLAYVDKERNKVRKFEGNPLHPGSRGRNCAKGPATINQIDDPDRILYPLKRVGKRGEGKWERVSWADALKDIGGKIAQAFDEDRKENVIYHVGRPGHEGYTNRVLQGWGIDGHNSHTTVCSAGARHGYSLWHKYDRPSPDHANAKVILLVSAHLESGHYFNPHAQRIMEGVMNGAKLVTLDPRLSNTASMSDLWLPVQPGSEAALFLAIARLMLIHGTYSESQFKEWTNWREFLAVEHAEKDQTWQSFKGVLLEEWDQFTPEFAAQEARIPVEQVHELYEIVIKAQGKLSAHTWRSASIGNLGGWQVSRTLHLLVVMTGSVGVEGGTMPSAWNKFKPDFFDKPPSVPFWNTFNMPDDWNVAQWEMSQCLPHIMRERDAKLDVYFTRVFNPVWTYPDGFSWIEMLRDEKRIGCHVAMTPTWNETAYFADYVLPMGHASERHDINSYEVDSGQWIAFRQPVLREAARRVGKTVERTYETNPGEVWEEDEFWIDLSWAIDPDGSRGIRKHFESPNDSSKPVTLDEYYSHIFDRVPGLQEAANKKDMSPLEYMKRIGAYRVKETVYSQNANPLESEGKANEFGTIFDDSGNAIGVEIDGQRVVGFPTPTRKMEIWSQSMKEHGWPEHTLPGWIKSHVHPDIAYATEGGMVLVPTFRLPTLIHTRTGSAKWLNEISNINPLWMHPSDMKSRGINNGDLVRVNTDIGYFIDKVWATEAIKPGICACSHHMGRWRRVQDAKANRYSANTVSLDESSAGWKMTRIGGIKPFKSDDPDTQRIFWEQGGVHQNAAAPIHPDPISGANCWLQNVVVEKAHAEDEYGTVYADTDTSFEIYKEWKAMCRPVKPGQLRRIPWLNRPLNPQKDAWLRPE